MQRDGSAWCFGAAANGELGQGNPATIVREYPGQVTGPRTFIAIGAGRDYSCGLYEGGAIATWGRNDSGQLGLGDVTDRDVPATASIPVHDRVSCGLEHACARRTDDTLWCWGANTDGQIGLGVTGTPVTMPAQVPGVWTDVGVGNDFTCALDDTGDVWCWGANADGNLGQGYAGSNSATPLQVTGEPT
jgi:alpha-tubulin suppressor-like RCC1 family protein